VTNETAEHTPAPQDDGPAAQETAAEGVIRFRYTLAEPQLVDTPPVATLRWAQGRGRLLGVLGRDPERYEGLAFGNLSLRAADGEGFWITASQRIDVDALAREDLVRVVKVTADGQVEARGTRPPSSETLTHGAVHSARKKGALVVFHGHSPRLWHTPPEGWGETPAEAANGTRALADAVDAAVRESPEAGALVLRGHEDGILLWAADFSELFQRLDGALADAEEAGA
jgi:hypothetical protein